MSTAVYEDIGEIGSFPASKGKTMRVRLVRDNRDGQYFIDFRNCYGEGQFTKEGFRIKAGEVKEFHRLVNNILVVIEELEKK
jgi:hypothetical protein